MAYASAYDELSYRPFRRRVQTHRGAPARRQQQGTPQDPRPARDPKRRLLRPEERLPLAAATPRVPAVEERLPLVPILAHREGTFERLNAALRERLRARLGRNPEPSARIVDSQSVRTTGVGGTERGFDPAKKVEGSKRHLLVDTEGLLLGVRVHSARVPDADGIRTLLSRVRGRFPRLSHLWVEAGYQGRGKKRWAEDVMGLSVEVVRKPQKPLPEEVAERWAVEWKKEGKQVDWQRLMAPRGFRVLPRRWVVERTFSWLGQNRRV